MTPKLKTEGRRALTSLMRPTPLPLDDRSLIKDLIIEGFRSIHNDQLATALADSRQADLQVNS